MTVTGDASPAEHGGSVRFDLFELSVVRRELSRGGEPIEIGQRGMDLLLALVDASGRVVSKDALIRAAWGERVVESSNLTVQIAKLRQVLGTSDGVEFIQTIHGQGYVFTKLVEPVLQPNELGPVPLRPVQRPHEPLTAFIGRERERRALLLILQSARLVTVSGIGGVGKTRLVMRLQHEFAAAFADGVVFVDLAPLVAPDQVKEAVAAAVGAGGDEASVDDTLAGALRDRRLLLILDNAEHLAAAVGQLVASILGACASVSAVVTSRESLGIPGETPFRLLPMAVPPATDGLSAARALEFDAVRLFADRAGSLLPGFRVDDDNAGPIATICNRLDGIALAIEMAVPRLEVLSVQQLAERLHDRFGTLASPRHEVPARQRTLRAMFDWSWELLSASQRRVLQLLAASVAGTTLSALERLAACDSESGATGTHVLNDLTALAQKSLVMVIAPGAREQAERRYQVLETTRQYALEQLGPDQRAVLSRLHAEQVAALFERAESEWPVTHGATWLARYGPEADNLRAAMLWAFNAPEDTELALRLVAASVALWWELPGLPLRESRRWYGLAMAVIGPATPPGVRGRIWFGQSWTDTLDGDLENFPAAMRAVALFREAQDSVWLGASLWRAAGTVFGREHEPAGAALLAEARRVLDREQATKWRALCHVREADRLLIEGALLPALAEYDRALTLVRSTGHSYGLLVCGGNRSYLLFQLGRHDEAMTALHALERELPDGLRQPVVSLLAVVQAAMGRDAEARMTVHRSLTGTPSIGMSATVARSVEALALLQARAGDVSGAGHLLGFVLKRHEANRARLGPRKQVFHCLMLILQQSMNTEEVDALLAHGASWTEAEALAVALQACVVSTG